MNALARMQNQNESASFENAPNGKYLAFYIQEENSYAVAPIFDTILDHRSYGPGAFGEVFECGDFNPQYRYTAKLIQPAIFEPDSAKEKWELKKQGKLELIRLP